MDNCEIGKLESFAQLLNEEESIVIPKVQRDYVYGRPEAKAKSVLNGLLNNILDAVVNNGVTILDFVYGGAFIREDKDVAGLIPLDGQQRLTTLFLLYFYASLLKDNDGNNVKESEVQKLFKFKYETRQTATDFCCRLLGEIRTGLLSSYQPQNQNVKSLIVDNAKYLKTYDSDPTIISMLNVLDDIEKKCIAQNAINLQPCLWERLMKGGNVLFYKLTLDKFGLTDDLFIKMNARGKKLTPFEIFKSDMIAKIKSVDEEKKDCFSTNMDTRWIDIAWDYTDKEVAPDKRLQLDVTNDVDVKYSRLFKNIFRLEYFRRELFAGENEDVDYNVLLSSIDGINSIEDIFETLYSIHKKVGFKELWAKYFYFSDSIVGQDDLIRLFWKQKQTSVFEIAINEEKMSVPEMVYFYSMYLLYKSNADDSCYKRCLRIIRNLMTANVRAVDARTNKLSGFLKEAKYIIDHQGYISNYDKDSGLDIDGEKYKLCFLQSTWNEEYKKQHILSDSEYNTLLKYENHQILNCSIALFMDYCTCDSNSEAEICLDSTRLLRLLKKFETIFDNNSEGNFYYLKTLFLDQQNEYMQCEPYMLRKGKNEKMRYFITKHEDWSDFFIKNNQRRYQNEILKILDSIILPFDIDGLKEMYKKFDTNDWRYYVAKYPKESNFEWTKYGLGVWDDPDQYPLDLILLNSSQHSEGNLEWKMLTCILKRKLNNGESYKLDDHGCSPILLTSCASTIGFKNGKWEIKVDRDFTFPEVLQGVNLSVSYYENGIFTVDFQEPMGSVDYVELGLMIVSHIEKSLTKKDSSPN